MPKEMTLDEKEREIELRKELRDIDHAETLDCSKMTRAGSKAVYSDILGSERRNRHAERRLCRSDLFFLLTVALNRKDADKDWLYARCREVQASPNGHLDLWAREHYKSTIITFAKSIQDLLRDPDGTTIGIFSHTRPIAKGFLEQIKRELETNEYLKDLFPDVLYQKPQVESPKWSLDSGIIVKRKSNPKEASVEAWGLVDGQPTSKHFTIQVYDDVVTRESVTTPEQIKKVTSAWELSLNLGAHGGVKRYIGTRYHIHDTYRVMIERGSVKKRVYPATHNGKMDGDPVFLSKELLSEKRRDMGPYTFGTQMLQDPVSDKAMAFKDEWLKFYETLGEVSKWNKYLLVDPASSKKATSDYTVMVVIGLASDGNYYLLDGIRDRLNLTQRANRVFELHRKWKPTAVGYEKYGVQADIEHIEFIMEQKNYRFNIIALGGSISKEDRIMKLIPVFEQRRFYMPKHLPFVAADGTARDFVHLFRTEEYADFPVVAHDDMLDCTARIMDQNLGADFPKIVATASTHQRPYVYGSEGWMG